MKTLKQIPPGQSAVVEKVLLSGQAKARLMALGILKGTVIQVVKVAPLGDPIEVQVRGYNLSFRKAEAEQIIVT